METLSAPNVDLETSSDRYATRFRGKTGEWFLKTQGEATLAMLSAWPGARVLEVGGGHGQLVPFLIDRGYKVSVLGSSDLCGERLKKFVYAGQCEFKAGNLVELPYADRSFDIVIGLHLLSHLDNWQQFSSELMRVADKAVIVDYPTQRSLNGALSKLFWLKKKLEGNTRQFLSYEEGEVVRYFEANGFANDARFAKFFMPMVVYRASKLTGPAKMAEKFFRNSGLTARYGSPVIACFRRKGAA